jgi:hypothetical protein
LPDDQAPALRQPLDTPEGRRLLTRLTGEDVAKFAAVLHPYPAKANLTVLATADPGYRVDFGDVAKLIDAWPPQIDNEKGQPILILGPDGMRLRLRHGTSRADRMEAFIDLALDLGRIL